MEVASPADLVRIAEMRREARDEQLLPALRAVLQSAAVSAR